MSLSRFMFGDIVVVNDDEIGLVLETCGNGITDKKYVKIWNRSEQDVEVWDEDLVDRYDILNAR